MTWVSAIIGVLVLWWGTALGATLAWNGNSEPDLAGYRIYQCSLIPCGPGSGHQSVLATVGTVTSFNIGTPTVTQYYFITAYDSANNESQSSNLITYTPPAAPPALLTPLKTISLRMVGSDHRFVGCGNVHIRPQRYFGDSDPGWARLLCRPQPALSLSR